MDFTLTFPPTFLGLHNGPLTDANVVTVPVAFEGTACFGLGTAAAPSGILRASTLIDYWDEELRWEPSDTIRFHTVPIIRPDEGEGVEVFHTRLFDSTRHFRDTDQFILSIGGEHSITAPIVKALCKRPEDLTVVQFDAHPDLLNSFQGTPFSHACVIRRIVELGCRVIQIGIRTQERCEYELACHSDRIETFLAMDLVQPCYFELLLSRLRGLHGPVYVSIDVDVLDGSCIQNTGTPQPGGLPWFTVLRLLRAVLLESSAHPIGADIVEAIVSSESALTATTAAKLGFKVVSYAHFSNRRDGL